MSDPLIGLSMLGLIVAAIMMGFPTAFTLMGLGMLFGALAFFDPAQLLHESRIFDLMVQRTHGAMNNDTLLSIPLFVLMGYIIERAALVDRMFLSVQLAFRRVPASLAVTTLLVCAFWGIASGIVGAVVVLMGVIALRPMLNAGYDVRLATGVITAGGTLGILIPPSVMLIVYAAVSGQSIVKLYAAAMLPGFFLTFLYLAYIIGWAMLNPKIAPKLPADQYRIAVPAWLVSLQRGATNRVLGGLLAAVARPGLVRDLATAEGRVGYPTVVKNALAALLPFLLTASVFATAWWYVMVHNAPQAESTVLTIGEQAIVDAPPEDLSGPFTTTEDSDDDSTASDDSTTDDSTASDDATDDDATDDASDPDATTGTDADSDSEGVVELGTDTATDPSADVAAPQGRAAVTPDPSTNIPLQQAEEPVLPMVAEAPHGFYAWFGGFGVAALLLLGLYYRRMDGEQVEIIKMLAASVMPLGVLTFIVLAVILLGITTATESAGIGCVGALYLVSLEKYRRFAVWSTLIGTVIGLGLGSMRGDLTTLVVSGTLAGVFAGTALPWIYDFLTERRLLHILQQSVFLTARTTAMVCWLFVGSALFSAVFALHGGQQLIEDWVLGLELSQLGFIFIAQAIIFLLGWPLEWTEIIVIFVPIFVPLLSHFDVDPVLFGTMVAVNLQAAFLSPPVAMSAFYLKGVAPKHVTLNQIFAGMMPYMLIVILCMAIMYAWPGMTLWLPNALYGN